MSGYHAAEWFAWNWWRLRYEPRSRAPDWWRAHRMAAIGEGYVWPNMTIFSDGVRTALLSKPSVRADAKPFRYLGATATILPSGQFEAAVDAFVSLMDARLVEHGLTGSNLSRLWAELLTERADPNQAGRRRIEALLARDPDDMDDDAVEAARSNPSIHVPARDASNGDLTPDAQQDAAEHFHVSEMTVRTLLVNHGQLEREELDPDLVA